MCESWLLTPLPPPRHPAAAILKPSVTRSRLVPRNTRCPPLPATWVMSSGGAEMEASKAHMSWPNSLSVPALIAKGYLGRNPSVPRRIARTEGWCLSLSSKGLGGRVAAKAFCVSGKPQQGGATENISCPSPAWSWATHTHTYADEAGLQWWEERSCGQGKEHLGRCRCLIVAQINYH